MSFLQFLLAVLVVYATLAIVNKNTPAPTLTTEEAISLMEGNCHVLH